MHKKFIVLFAFSAFISLSAEPTNIPPKETRIEAKRYHEPTPHKYDKWVTIFTHGGGAHPTYLNISDTFKIIHDDLERPSVYKKTTEILRVDPYYFQVHPQTYVGLNKVWPMKNLKERHGAHIFAEMFTDISAQAGLPPSDLYSFGWTGLLSITARRAAAKKFYNALVKLAREIRRQGYNPKIRIIAYSHGGNTSLHLAEIARNKKYTPFTIEELLLISTPIHENTQPYITSPLFKKIFLFYSKGDNIQLDFLSSPTNSFASHFFMEKNGAKVPDKVTQIQMRFFRTHLRIKKPDGSIKIQTRNEMVHPNHTEMFFFGWTPEWYRKYFPIRPLSVGLLIPFFLRDVKKHDLYGHSLRFTVYPETGKLGIKVKDEKRSFEVPFIKSEKLIALRKKMQSFSPYKRLPYKEFHQRMIDAREKAKKYIRSLKKSKRKALIQKRKQKNIHTGPMCNVALFKNVTT